MSTTPIKVQSVFRKLGIAFLLLAVIFGSLHLVLYYKANELVKAFVEQVSDGQYTAETKRLRFGYLPLRIKATEIHFFPIDSSAPRLYDISADTLQLKLTSLAPLLFYNSLEVRQVRLVRPKVVVRSDGSRIPREDVKFNIPLQEIQQGLLKSLDLLQVDNCEIVDGAFQLKRTDVNKNLSVNHIDISIDSMLAARAGMVSLKGDTAGILLHLTVTRPNIEIPDSNFHVELDKLEVDTRRNFFEIDELRLSRTKEKNAYDTLKLSRVSLKGLNWNLLLEKGIVELDTVRVANGIAQVDLTDRFIFQRKKKQHNEVRATIDLPLILHHVEVQQVEYKLRSRRKTGLFTILLDGDNLVINSFSLLDTTPRPLNVASLSLNVRNYFDQDDNKTYVASFDRLFIRQNDLFISNYKIIPLRKREFSANNRIEAPFVSLIDYNLGALLSGQLEAKSLELTEPFIVLDIMKPEADSGTVKKGGRGLFEVLNRLQSTLDIGQLKITNAKIILQPRRKFADTIQISQLNTQIDVERLLGAHNVSDLMQVTEGIKSDGFFITGSKFEFKVTNASISPVENFIEMEKLQGSLESGIQMDLDFVQVSGRPGEMMMPVDGVLNFSRVAVASGDVMVTARKPDSVERAKKPAPILNIDSLFTGDIELTYINKNGAASTIKRLALDVTGLQVDNSKVSWIDALVEGSGLQTGMGNTNISSAVWYGSFPGSFSLEDVKIWPTSRHIFGITSAIRGVKIDNEINSLDWDAHAIKKLEIKNPHVRWTLATTPGKSEAQKPPPPIFLPKLIITDPDLDGYRITSTGDRRHSVLKGGRIELDNIDVNYTRPDEISVSKLSALLPEPKVEVDENWTLHPASVRLLGSSIVWKKGQIPRGIMDSVLVEGIGDLPVFNKGNQSLEIGFAGVSDWYFPSPTDSFIFKLANGPNWWVGGANYTLKGKNGDLKVYNASAKRQNRTIIFDSMVMVPHLSRDSFWKSNAFEKDFITLKLGKTTINNFQPATLDMKGAHLQSMFINDLELLAARDKRYPDDTVGYRYLLARQLQKLPFQFIIDTLGLENGRITYREIGPKFGLEGALEIDEVYGNIYNVITFPHEEADSLILDLKGKLFAEAPFRLLFSQPYFDSMQRFNLQVDLGKWNLIAANPFLAPLISMEFRRGFSDSMWFQGLGNDRYAYGWMGFYYNSMKVGLLKNGKDREYFLSGTTNLLANLVLKNNNKGQATPFYVERLRNKSIFNLWGKMLSSAMMGNVGMPGKKKAARKAIRKANLEMDSAGK